MRILILALLLSSAGIVPAGSLSKDLYKDLTPGPYRVRIKGMMTRACGRMIEAEFTKHPAISEAEADFDAETVVFSVMPDRRVKIDELRKLLRRASKRMRITSYVITDIRYMPVLK